jgi:two-component system LytT family sensor kinase
MGLNRNNAYWWCQIIGWVVYGLTMIFFAFVFNQNLNIIFYLRLSVSIIIGFAFTHIFREIINQKNIYHHYNEIIGWYY